MSVRDVYGFDEKSPLGSLTEPPLHRLPPEEAQRKMLELLKADPFFKNEKPLKDALMSLDLANLQVVLDAFIQELTSDGFSKDALAIVKRMADVLPVESIQEVVRLKFPGCKEALATAKDMLESSKYYLKSVEGNGFSWSAAFASVLETLIAIVESILNVFGIADFFKPAESSIHADMKFQKVMMLVTLLSLLSAILMPLLGPIIGGAIVGGTFITIAVLSLVYPYIRPVPAKLTPECENLHEVVRQSPLSTIGGREEGAKAIADALIRRKKKVRVTPIVLGDTGVGKTQTVKLFVKHLDEGRYSELAGKKAHCVNGADLANNQEMFGGGNRNIAKISEAMGYNRDEVILVIDEAHEMFIEKEGSNIAGQLKTRLDEGLASFPFVVLLTTQKEYEEHILTHLAMNDRFEPIHIESMKKDETIEVLTHFVLQKAPSSIVDTATLEHLWDLTTVDREDNLLKGGKQPGSVLKILTTCIQRTSDAQKSPLELQLEEKRRALRALHAQGALGGRGDASQEQKRLAAIRELTDACIKLEREIGEQREQRQALFNARELLAQVKTAMHHLVVETAPLSEDRLSAGDRAQVGTFLLLNKLLIPAFAGTIGKRAERLDVNAVITRDLVEKVVGDELENKRKTRDILERTRRATPPQAPAGPTVGSPGSQGVVRPEPVDARATPYARR